MDDSDYESDEYQEPESIFSAAVIFSIVIIVAIAGFIEYDKNKRIADCRMMAMQINYSPSQVKDLFK